MRKKTRHHVTRTFPDAFNKEFPPILHNEIQSALAEFRPTQSYKMGKLFIAFSAKIGVYPAMLSVNHPSRLPTWDEMVWIRYQIYPDIVDIAFILPPLDEYINFTSGREKNTFTMEEIVRGVR